jgi:ketosteroid isomerase-like protein
MRTESDRRQIDVAQEYFRRVDAGRADLLDLMTDNIEFWFPKFGIGRGKPAFGEMAAGMGRVFEFVEHDFRTYSFICSGTTLVVEGTTRGQLKTGQSWAAGMTPGGRFCNVFEFHGDLISRVYIYLDPDYVSEDTARFLWGRDGRTW